MFFKPLAFQRQNLESIFISEAQRVVSKRRQRKVYLLWTLSFKTQNPQFLLLERLFISTMEQEKIKVYTT